MIWWEIVLTDKILRGMVWADNYSFEAVFLITVSVLLLSCATVTTTRRILTVHA